MFEAAIPMTAEDLLTTLHGWAAGGASSPRGPRGITVISISVARSGTPSRAYVFRPRWKGRFQRSKRQSRTDGPQRQAFQWHKAVCFGDATNEVFRRLHLRPLGTNQSEDHRLVIRDVPEWCKRARPIIVVFEEKSRCTGALENRPGNWLIVALDEPTAFLVASMRRSRRKIPP